MRSSMTTRSTAVMKSENEIDEVLQCSNAGDSDVQQHRIDALEEQVKKMTITLDSIPYMLMELKKLIVSKPPTSTASDNVNVPSNHDNRSAKEDDDNEEMKPTTSRSELVHHLKIITHFYSIFPIVTLPANFKRYDILLKFFIDIETKIAYHDVPSHLQVKILLRSLEGSDEVTEFLRRTKKFRNDHVLKSSDIETWVFEEFKREFILMFLDQGSIYYINDVLNSWHSSTFSSIRKSIDEYNLLMKFIREINLVRGSELDTNLRVLSNSNLKFFIRTLSQATHDQVILHMEVNDLGESRIRDVISSRLKLIYDLEYRELSEILLTIESKKEISKSLFPAKPKNQAGYVHRNLLDDASASLKPVVIIPCLNFMRGTCTYGERCFKSHDQVVIDTFKKTDEYKKMLEEYKKKSQS